MGSYHIERGINNQDYGCEIKNVICICDGCSEGLHSEVGAKLFIKKFRSFITNNETETHLINEMDIHMVFDDVFRILVEKNTCANDIRNYMCFTIMLCQKIDHVWHISVYGDGFILIQTHENDLQFININHSPTPHYYIYTYLKIVESIKEISHVPSVVKRRFHEKNVHNVFIASDGVSYIIDSPYEDEFQRLLMALKPGHLKRFINKLNLKYHSQNGFFKDDITIGTLEGEK